jgi:hypothetical protein
LAESDFLITSLILGEEGEIRRGYKEINAHPTESASSANVMLSAAKHLAGVFLARDFVWQGLRNASAPGLL